MPVNQKSCKEYDICHLQPEQTEAIMICGVTSLPVHHLETCGGDWIPSLFHSPGVIQNACRECCNPGKSSEHCLRFDAWRNMSPTDFLLQASLPEKYIPFFPCGLIQPACAVVKEAPEVCLFCGWRRDSSGISDMEVT